MWGPRAPGLGPQGPPLNPSLLGSQFEYLTDCPPLNANIEKNLRTFLTDMELYLTKVNDSTQAVEDVKNVETVCELEFQGSTLFRDLHL